MRATTAAKTDPVEKKAESAVTRYWFSFGTFSRISVPSVGMEPCKLINNGTIVVGKAELTPTELPRRKRVMQIVVNELEKDASNPKIAVKKSVPLKAALRPTKSEPLRINLSESIGNIEKEHKQTGSPSNSSDHHPSKHRRGNCPDIFIRYLNEVNQ